MAGAAGNLIMGCDICQEVCPYNISLAGPAKNSAFTAGAFAGDEIPLTEILQITNDRQYLERFAGSPLMRPKREGLVKNAINAAINAITQNPDRYSDALLPLIEKIASEDENPRLRETANLYLKRLSAI